MMRRCLWHLCVTSKY